MAFKVLKSFDYSRDGINSRRTAVDEILDDVPADHIGGLVAEGYIEPEVASKIAGDAILSADLAGTVDSDKAVKQEGAQAAAGISDGHVGAPEAATIVDAHKLTDLSDPVTVQAAQDEKAAHEAGDTSFDPKAPENVAAAEKKVADGSAFDHDGDGAVGGSLPKSKRAPKK